MSMWIGIAMMVIELIIKWLQNRKPVPGPAQKKFSHLLARMQTLQMISSQQGYPAVEDPDLLIATDPDKTLKTQEWLHE